MFRIRRIFDDVAPASKRAVDQVCRLLRKQFPLLKEERILKVPVMLRNPVSEQFRAILYVAENRQGKVGGFALLLHDPVLKFGYLDYLASDPGTAGRGIGGALYEVVREEALLLDVSGIFFECLPDDPTLSPDPVLVAENRRRLAFYEHYGARPLEGTGSETPVKPGLPNPPYLVFDDLGQGRPLSAGHAREVARAILQRTYSDICTPAYIDLVTQSFLDDPVRIRPPRYARSAKVPTLRPTGRLGRIALVVTDVHAIHHVRERGYVESPVRIATIQKALGATDLFFTVPPREFSEAHIREVHDDDYLNYFKRVCRDLDPDESVYPYVFPIRQIARPPRDLAVRAGYYCIDTFTPLSANAFRAAKRAVDCALTAASELLAGSRMAYALVRPPGHHAEKRSFGGFCYFNNAAVAAQFLSAYGRVAILDVDYHHGNGQQIIFYSRSDVLTVSIHGEPAVAYPYFSGFADETGQGKGRGFNVNIPLPETIVSADYFKALERALRAVRAFSPVFLVVCLGLDTAKGDPTGSWPLRGADFEHIGAAISTLGYPTLVTQEGGYDNRVIGSNARHFFEGLASGAPKGALRAGSAAFSSGRTSP